MPEAEHRQQFDSAQLAKVPRYSRAIPIAVDAGSGSIIRVQKIVARQVTAVLKGVEDLSMPATRFSLSGPRRGWPPGVRDLKVASFCIHRR